MRAKSIEKVELPEKVVKLLEEAYIVVWHLDPLSAKAFSEKFKEENSLVYITSLLLAAIDDAKKPRCVDINSLFRHALGDDYLERAKEILG